MAAGARRPGGRWPWLAVAAACVVAWVALTWPLALHPDHLWSMAGDPAVHDQTNFAARPGGFASSDALQTVFIQSVVVDNLRNLREPYLDLREGAAGPAPLRTTSLDLPWTPVFGLLWPLVGMMAAYNATLLLGTVATGLTAFGLLRRHTRLPLLAALGALAYSFTPSRMFQLANHFNAVMWWAFPAALWALEAAFERHAAGRPWRGPALGVVAVTLTVALSGEHHLVLYLVPLLAFMTVWQLGVALVRRRPPPWGPLALAATSLALASAYVLVVFARVFNDTVAGGNGSYAEVELYAPVSRWALVLKDYGTSGEGLVYVGWALVALAAAGVLVAPWRRRALPYALLVVPLVALTYGPRADVGSFRPYRFLFERLPLLTLQRVPERLMVVTALVLVVLAVTAADAAAGLAAAALARSPARSGVWRRRLGRAGAALLLLASVALLADYHVSPSRLQPGQAGNPVVAALQAAGDRAGPILGLPVLPAPSAWNSAATYLAAQSRRRSLNAYNQTSAPWLDLRLDQLEPLNHGLDDPAALDVLRQTGTRQMVVIDQPRYFAPGAWQQTVDLLVASGHFKLVEKQAPLALLELLD